MALHIYKTEDFEYTHERQGFRKIICALEPLAAQENIYLLANATLPVVTHTPPTGKPRTYYNCSPDLILFKEDAIAVLEMKSHSGLIRFPTEQELIWKGDWIYENNGKQMIINEGGKPNPYSQLNSNRKAVIAYLEEKQDLFADEDTAGSRWHKAEGILLFTQAATSFADAKPSFWRNTHAATFGNDDPEFDFQKIIADLTTGPRIYGQDDRSEIFLTNRATEKIIADLGGVLFEDAPGAALDSIEPERFAPEYGFASIVPGTSDQVVSEYIEDEVSYEPDEDYLASPLPIRLIGYYSACLEETARISSQLNLNNTKSYYSVQNMDEPIFFGNGWFDIDRSDVPAYFLNTNTRLTYGFLPVVDIFSGAPQAKPLFMTDVHFSSREGGLRCEPLAENDLSINREAMRKLAYFKDMTTEELDEYVHGLASLPSSQERIRQVFRDVVPGAGDVPLSLKGLNVAQLATGLVPAAFLFSAESNFYRRTINELNTIAADWIEECEAGNEIDDLAWKFMSGLCGEDLDQEWKPPQVTVVPSNYEQTMAIGLALQEGNALQVISGPPGTGKSQVIQNIIVNCGRKGEKSLFASYNNQAVNVVVNRLNKSTLHLPYIIRCGNKSQNENTKIELANLKAEPASDSNPGSIIEIRKRLREMNRRLSGVNSDLNRYQNARLNLHIRQLEAENMLDEYENVVDLQDAEENLGTEILEKWKSIYEDFEEKAALGSSFIGRVNGRLSGMRPTDILSSGLYQIALRRVFNEMLQRVIPVFLQRTDPSVDTLELSRQLLPIIDKWTSLNREIEGYIEALETLSEDDLLDKWTSIEKEKLEASRELIRLEWSGKFNETISKDAEKVLNSSSPDPHFFNSVLNGFSCVATTSLSAGRIVPLEPGLFDVVIIDEASQSDVASMIPLLYRGRRGVIIGDEMQLRPIISIDEETDRRIAHAFEINGADYGTFAYYRTGLLDLAYDRFTRAGGARLLLKDHYRSHPEIINFSNVHFYDRQLRIRSNIEEDGGVRWHHVDGSAAPKWKNQSEVNKVTEIISSLIGSGFSHEDIGVVTPFRLQANTLINSLQQKGLFNSGDKQVTVGTAHSYQGDEKKAIVFSLAIAPNMSPRVRKWIHDVNTYSKNLLNVALTRAQSQLHIVGNRDLCLQEGGLLEHLVLYVDGIK